MSSLFRAVQWEALTLLSLPRPLRLLPVSLGHFGPQFFSRLTHSSHPVWAQALLFDARLSQITRDKSTAPPPSSFSICLPYFLSSFVDSKLIVWVYSKGRDLAWLFQAIFIEWINSHTQASLLPLHPYPGGIQLRGFPFLETSIPLNHYLCPPPPRHTHTHTFLTPSHPTPPSHSRGDVNILRFILNTWNCSISPQFLKLPLNVWCICESLAYARPTCSINTCWLHK